MEDREKLPADIVVSGAHVQTTMLGLLEREHLPSHLERGIQSLRVGNGIGMTVRCVIDDLPNYRAATIDAAQSIVHRPSSIVHHGMQLICPGVEYLQRAYNDSQQGRPAERPALVAMTPSAVDPTIAPSGKHSLYVWAQYHPYALANGVATKEPGWDDIREREADRIIETLAEYAPNVTSSITHRYIQTPLDLERNIGLLRGNIMHIDMSLDQMFMFRPLPELSQYRTHIRGLYLTGASTHPGGGVSGASGRNAASVVLTDLQSRQRSWQGWAAGGLVAAAVLVRRAKRKWS